MRLDLLVALSKHSFINPRHVPGLWSKSGGRTSRTSHIDCYGSVKEQFIIVTKNKIYYSQSSLVVSSTF